MNLSLELTRLCLELTRIWYQCSTRITIFLEARGQVQKEVGTHEKYNKYSNAILKMYMTQNWEDNYFDLNYSLALDEELRPLNPTTFSFDVLDITVPDFLSSVVFFPPEVAFFELLVADFTAPDFLLSVVFFPPEVALLELLAADFGDLDILIGIFVDLIEAEAFPGFGPEVFSDDENFPRALDDFSTDADLLLFFWFEIFIDFEFFSAVIWDLATSLLTLSKVRDSKLSFFIIACSIREASIKSFFVTKLVTLPVQRGYLDLTTQWDKQKKKLLQIIMARGAKLELTARRN